MRAASSGLTNRVAPDGALFATPARGLMMGNRGGRIHDAATRTLQGRPYATRQWICCVLSFRGRQRKVWGAKSYSELFFCDEVTALAAGHRPCMECRRSDTMAYRHSMAARLGMTSLIPCPELDKLLDGERRVGRAKRLHRLAAESLPDGAMIRAGDGTFWALKDDAALAWSPTGYVATRARPEGLVDVLTPPSSLAALSAGYLPIWAASSAMLTGS